MVDGLGDWIEERARDKARISQLEELLMNAADEVEHASEILVEMGKFEEAHVKHAKAELYRALDGQGQGEGEGESDG